MRSTQVFAGLGVVEVKVIEITSRRAPKNPPKTDGLSPAPSKRELSRGPGSHHIRRRPASHPRRGSPPRCASSGRWAPSRWGSAGSSCWPLGELGPLCGLYWSLEHLHAETCRTQELSKQICSEKPHFSQASVPKKRSDTWFRCISR